MNRCLSLLLLLFTGCVRIPSGLQPVSGFDADRYLGKWYEIARLDHSFERGLSHVTARYTPREDGGIGVINRGYRADRGEWKEARGKAYFVESPDRGYLKVSFFGPFYGSYVVFELDRENYQYALVSGPNRSYLWLLARSPDLESATRERLIARAAELGFATRRLIFVDHAPF